MTMDAYISTMSTMADKITASGIEIQETDLITTILSKLPEDYKTVKRIILSKDPLTLQFVSAQFLLDESRLNSKSEEKT